MIRINGAEYSPTIFPDRTSQVWKIENFPQEQIVILWDYDDESEVMHLIQLMDLIESSPKVKTCVINIPYCPYARQHHDIDNQKTFALNTFLSLLSYFGGSQKFSFVFLDIHNTELLDDYIAGQYTNIIPTNVMKEAINDVSAHIVVFPDEGACKRYSGHLKDAQVNFVYAEKVRDPTTGAILETKIPALPVSNNILVIDDICDGGATFINLAALIKQHNPNSLGLYVTHGIFSKGIKILTDAGYNSIWTAKGKIV